MAKTTENKPISAWRAGDNVSGYALLARKERRQDRTGRDYIDLQLADATGRIDGKIWGDSPALNGEFEAHDFVAFQGAVKSYRDRLQINVQRCRRVTDEDRAAGFDEGQLVPTTSHDINDLWRRLKKILEEEVRDPLLNRLARESLAAFGPALREHPAAKSIHHAYRGGLLEHVVSMAELALQVGRHYSEINLDLLLVGVFFHDLGKTIELGKMPQNEYTPAGRLVGHVALGRDLLRERCAEIEGFPEETRLHLEHLVLAHQGRLEFGSPVEPMTAEALVLHMIDDLDAKLAQLRQAAEESEGFQYLRGFGRMVLVAPQGDRQEDGSQEEEGGPAQLPLEA